MAYENEMKLNKFNGGKMLHIFVIKDSKYDTVFQSEDAEHAFKFGHFFIKIDGSNHMIKVIDGVHTLFQRYDDKKGKVVIENEDKLITLNPGNMIEYESDNCKKKVKHHYYYKRIDRVADDAKGKQNKIIRQMYAILDAAIPDNQLLLCMQEGDSLTCEMVGKKFNATPNVNDDVNIAIHCEQHVVIPENKRNYEGIQEYLKENCCEGLVVEDGDIYWKVRSNLIIDNCDFEKDKSKAKIPVMLNK